MTTMEKENELEIVNRISPVEFVSVESFRTLAYWLDNSVRRNYKTK